MDLCLELGQEAGHVSEVYEKVQEAISQPPVKDYVPFTWVSLVQVKKEHYRALSNYYVAIALLDNRWVVHWYKLILPTIVCQTCNEFTLVFKVFKTRFSNSSPIK